MSVTEREIIRFSQISVEPPANRASFRESLPTESFQHLIAPLAELERQLSEPRDVPSRLSTITSSTALSALLDSQGITRSLTPAPRVVPTPEPSAHLLDTSEETVITPPITPTSEASATPSSTGLPRDSFGIRPLPVLPTATSGPPAFSGASGKRRAPPPVLRVIPAAPHIAEAEQSPLPVLSVSQRSSYSTSDTGISSSGSLRSIRPLPVLPRKASAEKVVQEPSRSNTMQSRRTTMTSVWSQDSAETHGHPVDVEAAISWSELSEGKRTSAGSSSTSSINQENRVRENAPARNGTFGAVPVPATLRPRTPLSNFTVRFTGANAAKRSSRGGSLLSGFSILPSPMAGKNSNAYASRSLPKGPSVSSRP
ncbi:hypothetical protein SERLA73DRAFT_122908 [Serpula lacrymans var. lacrymans S7.3]|uniref:Uncharacterized protein n=2 Tax=Serpula lacrymans var. lacrymans TaxID=341189 RepID=F8PYW1_SERL3|nr:uncharacterized protein SERLADRAFT_468268 [Serpula lacrymans var. lacrymans S7.9]EGN99074.1 hypothetical protein SERLA73DRAFT_122908 [Serpula lacrymans var. lacrymans S7.3]EGO24649.1 hypothetical protein SERLADRAFT_468268 [Serpula lacrymans var. lacrymans S7.9]